jgi:hypothetical protein
MFTTQVYKYEYNNIVYVGGQVPDGANILETMDILNAEEGYELLNIYSNETFGSIWLKDGDTQENYREIKIKEPSEIME